MSWAKQELVDEILIVDNSGGFKIKTSEYNIKVFSLSENMGVQAKYPIALLAKNEWVIYVDDDIFAKPGLAKDLYKYRGEDRAVGIIGRIFNGKSYYTSQGVRGENIDNLTEVGWVGGGCALTHRVHGAVEVSKCPAMEIDGWWWEDERDLLRFVIPTKNYKFLRPDTGIHVTNKCKVERQKYYAQTQSR